jgi:hypothetical protein
MVTFTAADNDTIELDPPEWSYIPRLHLGFEVIETSSGYAHWDNSIANDYRTCEIDRSILDAVDAIAFDAFITDHLGETLEMDVGTGTNFFPFLPDKGDFGTFTVKILDRKFGQFDQFRQFSKSYSLLMVSAPAYTTPEIAPQGDFKMGPVDGLMYPQLGIDPSVRYGAAHGVSYGGDHGMIDIGVDVHVASFTQRCNKGLAAALIAFLGSSVGRFQDIEITAPEGYYLFGSANGSSGTYIVKMAQNVIECRHNDFEEFEIPLSFWMRPL